MNSVIKHVEGNGVRLAVRDQGSGSPVLVFLHYWGGSFRTWDRVIQLLTPSFRCVAYDHRGWGESTDDPKVNHSLRLLADDAFAVIASLEIERYVLVGHSMGGKLAQYIASRSPKGLEGIVLVAPAPPNPQVLPPEAFEVQKHAYDCAENVAGAIDFLTQTPLSSSLRQQVIEDSLRGSSTAKYGWPNLMQFEDISQEVAGIQVPTLILAGEDDREHSLAYQRSEVLARISGAELVVLQNAGHLLPLEKPEEVAAAIRNFLQ